MDALTVGEAAARSGWSPRMLRYLERIGLVVPARTRGGYRAYGLRELNQLRSLAELRRRFGVALDELAFAVRLRREPELRAAVETWLAGSDAAHTTPAWVEWEQRKHERLLAA
ncbi:MAG TPA: MerR family DNA-binding transcriptional regulator [Gaiellaceae bacterium]|nr:MerR family DNA-binding transcriptional regulator [Gaiellaceae bacterium]